MSNTTDHRTPSDVVGEQIEEIAENIRAGLSQFIGTTPTPNALTAAFHRVLDSMGNDLIPSGSEVVLKMALEMSFGLRDPVDVINVLESMPADSLKTLVDVYGPGPDGLFMMVDLKRRGEIEYVVTGHRPGSLEMTVTYKKPLHYIQLDVVLKDEET